jgi:hypothetical protein
MKMKTLLAAAGLLAASLPFAASAESVRVGVLTCDTVAGSRVNLIVRSTTDVTCEFKDSQGKSEKYKGESGIALGLDLSFQTQESFAFAVLSSSKLSAGSHSLAGKYVGGKASATAGVGLAAAALVGGSNDSFGLNPIAVGSNQGLGAAAGIGFLYIEAAK